MGTWGMKPFENDCAGDFTDALARSAPDILATTIASTEESADIDAYIGQQVIVCAMIIAVMNGFNTSDLPPTVRQWIQDHSGFDSRPLIPKTLHALDRIMAGPESSELYELWGEGLDFDAWKSSVDEIYAYLQSLPL